MNATYNAVVSVQSVLVLVVGADLYCIKKEFVSKSMAIKIEVKALYMAFGKFLRRNFVSISFPVLTATLIWLDWNHTQKWKVQLKQN